MKKKFGPSSNIHGILNWKQVEEVRFVDPSVSLLKSAVSFIWIMMAKSLPASTTDISCHALNKKIIITQGRFIWPVYY